jgi:hypothetical protein
MENSVMFQIANRTIRSFELVSEDYGLEVSTHSNPLTNKDL